MGKAASKEEATEIDNSYLRLDLLHIPTAVTGSTIALIVIILVFLLMICCCRPSLTKFCFRKVFKDVHHHLPLHQPSQSPYEPMTRTASTYEPINGPAFDQTIYPPVRQAPAVVRMEAPAFPQQQVYTGQAMRPAIIYQPSAPTINAANRISEVNDDPTAHL